MQKFLLKGFLKHRFGFVVEQTMAISGVTPYFYRTAAGAEINLLLEFPGGKTWAVEIKSGTFPKGSRGFYSAINDLCPTRAFLLHGGTGRYPISKSVEAIGLLEWIQELRSELG
jgi:hypothetical protein